MSYERGGVRIYGVYAARSEEGPDRDGLAGARFVSLHRVVTMRRPDNAGTPLAAAARKEKFGTTKNARLPGGREKIQFKNTKYNYYYFTRSGIIPIVF